LLFDVKMTLIFTGTTFDFPTLKKNERQSVYAKNTGSTPSRTTEGR
jgi:hypothetical protein